MIRPEKTAAHEGCSCGDSCHSGQAEALAPHELPSSDFSLSAETCTCDGYVCLRRYLALTGFILGVFLVLHLAINLLGLWPARFQTAVNRLHGLGVALPVLEIGLIFIPLTIHVALGLRTLHREKLTFGIEKHHHGSDTRYWLQRVSAVILLAFLAFHLATMHRWGLHLVFRLTHWPALERFAAGGLFEPSRAFASVRDGLRNFCSVAAGNPANLFIAQFYLLAIAAAVYHLANGVAIGADVLGCTRTARQQYRLWHICIVSGTALGAIGMAAWYAFVVK
jgi:succinate dehydrogenase/fumarate reductase cytochrome b subunit